MTSQVYSPLAVPVFPADPPVTSDTSDVALYLRRNGALPDTLRILTGGVWVDFLGFLGAVINPGTGTGGNTGGGTGSGGTTDPGTGSGGTTTPPVVVDTSSIFTSDGTLVYYNDDPTLSPSTLVVVNVDDDGAPYYDSASVYSAVTGAGVYATDGTVYIDGSFTPAPTTGGGTTTPPTTGGGGTTTPALVPYVGDDGTNLYFDTTGNDPSSLSFLGVDGYGQVFYDTDAAQTVVTSAGAYDDGTVYVEGLFVSPVTPGPASDGRQFPSKMLFPGAQTFPQARKSSGVPYPGGTRYPGATLFPGTGTPYTPPTTTTPVTDLYPADNLYPADLLFPSDPGTLSDSLFPADDLYPADALFPADLVTASTSYPSDSWYPSDVVYPLG